MAPRIIDGLWRRRLAKHPACRQNTTEPTAGCGCLCCSCNCCWSCCCCNLNDVVHGVAARCWFLVAGCRQLLRLLLSLLLHLQFQLMLVPCVCAVCVGVVGVVVVVVDSCWCCCCSCHSPQLFAWKTVPTPSADGHEGQCAVRLTERFTVQYRLARASATLSPLPRRQNSANSKGRQPRRQMCRQVTGGQEGLATSHPRSRRVRQHAEHTNALDPPGMGAQAPSPIFQELRTIAHVPGAP